MTRNELSEQSERPYDYRCPLGHVFTAPTAEHGGPWATLVCPKCGATAFPEYDLRASSDTSDNEV